MIDEKNEGWLRPRKRKVQTYKIVGFDTEDYEGTPVAYCFYNGSDYFYTKDALEALSYIYNLPRPTVLVCHNLQYDIANLFKGLDYFQVDSMIFASRLISVTLANANPKKLYFMDSCSFFSGTLAGLGDLIGMSKGSGSAFDEKYVMQDAKIVYTFMAMIQERLNADGLSLTLTVGSMAMADYTTNYLPSKLRTWNSKLCLEAYYGGRVELFYKGFCEGPIYYADINSSYPSVMRDLEYPDTSRVEPSTLASHHYGVGRFTVEVPLDCFVPPLPFHSPEGRLFFPTGTFEGVWTYAEVRYAMTLGVKIISESTGEGCRYGCRPFVSFIDDNYAKRQDAKASREKKKLAKLSTNEEDFDDLYYKLKMNNLYGKFSQHKDKTVMVRRKLTPSKAEALGLYKESKIGPFYHYKVRRTEAPKTANYMWGTYVTSYARISLLKKLYAVHKAGGKLLYCDTDSVMFENEGGLAGLTISKNLGDMGFKKFDCADFLMSKGYILYNKTKGGHLREAGGACKGVSQIHSLYFYKHGEVTYKKPNKLKSALITKHAEVNRGKSAAWLKEHDENMWNDVTKTMRSIYFKRSGDKGITYPVNAAEIDALEMKDFSEEAKKIRITKDFKVLPKVQKKKDGFQAIKMPKGWEKTWFKKDETECRVRYEAQGVEYLNTQSCLDLDIGDSWLSGVVVAVERDKKQRVVYRVNLQTYTGLKAAIMDPVALPAYHFSPEIFTGLKSDYNFIGKNIEFILVEKYLAKYSGQNYIGNTPLILRGKVLNEAYA